MKNKLFAALFVLACLEVKLLSVGVWAKSFQIHKRSICNEIDGGTIVTKIASKKVCKRDCKKDNKCLAFQFRKKNIKCELFYYTPDGVSSKKNFICGIVVTETTPPPTPAPTSFEDQWLIDGRVDFEDDSTTIRLQSDAQSDLGIIVTAKAYNDADVDFMVEYHQQTFEDEHTGYEGQLYLFLVPTGTYPETLGHNDNSFGDFHDMLVGYIRSKIYTNPVSPIDATYLQIGSSGEGSTSDIVRPQYKSLTLRIRRFNGEIYGYYRVSANDEWIQVNSPLQLPDEMKTMPLQVGLRVKKEWKTFYDFTLQVQKLAGGAPLDIPTKAPTAAPTETKTWIEPGTQFKPPSCPSNLDRSAMDVIYQTRGIGGGGAMSGLSISPWNDLWFVGTDMGTLFRSTDAGYLWYPVNHNEQRFTNFLPKSGPVGYTSDPDIVVFASCKNLSSHTCVARRSTDAGITWTPIDITGGSLTDNDGNPALDYIPHQFVGSLLPSSDVMFATMNSGGGVYRSSNNGLDWAKVILPFNDTNEATGLYFDQSSSPAQVYFATSHSIFMWEDGQESQARQIWSPSEGTLIQSFSGGRSADTGRLSLFAVDDDISACSGKGDEDCGYVYVHSSITDPSSTLAADLTFTKTTQKGYRVVSSPTDASLVYVTGARSWPNARGTAVWVGKWTDVDSEFAFNLKFLQSDVDNGYANWPADKLDYSAVGLDVGYWDGGYYTFNINPRNALQAGGSGNFFLHVTRDGGDHWDSAFTEHADSCNGDGSRRKGQRWRSTGLEMTSVRWLKFNPHNTSYAFASVADIRMLRSDDSGETWEISGGSQSGLYSINTMYDYAFAGPHTVFGVGGNFHDWPHGWYKNLMKGAGGVFISVDSGSSWRRLGSENSMNCNDSYHDVDCSNGNDMVRQILSVEYDDSTSTLYVGTQSAGVARLTGLEPTISSGTFEELDKMQWEWINNGLGSSVDRIIPEIKIRNGKLYCLLTGDASKYTNDHETGIYQWDESNSRWLTQRATVLRPSNVESRFDLWAYPTGFDIDVAGNMWLIDMETNFNYLASGVWKSSDGGSTWTRMQQFTFPYHIVCVGNRVYVSGAKAWGEGGLLHSDDGGLSWIKNEDIPLLRNANSAVIDPRDDTKIYYTFFGGGMMHGPVPE